MILVLYFLRNNSWRLAFERFGFALIVFRREGHADVRLLDWTLVHTVLNYLFDGVEFFFLFLFVGFFLTFSLNSF